MNTPAGIRSTILLFLSLVICLSARAVEEKRSKVSLGVEGGLAFPVMPSNFSKEYDSARVYGGRIRCDINNKWALATHFSSQKFKRKSIPSQWVQVQPLTGSLYYCFPTRSTFWNPTAAFHLGVSRNTQNLKTLSKLTTGLGLGLEIDMTDLTSLSLESHLRAFPGASTDGRSLQSASASLLVNFYLPESWVPVKPKKPLNFGNIQNTPEVQPLAEDDLNRKEAQEELDRVQQDIRKRKIPLIHFETGQAVLMPASYETLDIIGTILRRYPQFKVRIEGHTDEVGTPEDNMILSQARSEVVRAYLLQNFGLLSNKLFTSAFGETQPFAGNKSDEGRNLNRRVEFKIIP